jgi:hypothetical protein
MNGNTKRLTELAKTFPDLADVMGAEAFDVGKMREWLEGPGAIGGAYHAAQFLLMVAGVGQSFDVVSAMITWNDACKAAFLAWAKDPWTAGGR